MNFVLFSNMCNMYIHFWASVARDGCFFIGDYKSQRKMSYRQTYRNPQQQQNYPLNVNYTFKRDKKYSYQQQQQLRSSPNPNQLQQLRKELKEQRQKVKALQARTIQQQCTVLNHLEVLQAKFHDLSQEKQNLQVQLNKMRQENQWKAKYIKLQQEHRHVKGISESMIDMMRKCQGTQGDLHEAWRWVKKVVWQYQGIRKKALQWKQVYDQVTAALPLSEGRQN